MILLGTVTMIKIYQYSNQINLFVTQATDWITSFLSNWAHIAIIVFSITIPTYIINTIVERIKERKAKERAYRSRIYDLKEKVRETITNYYNNHDIKLEQFIESLKEVLKELRGYEELDEQRDRVEKELKEKKNQLIEWAHERSVLRINAEKEAKEKELWALEEKEQMIRNRLENNKNEILERLDADSNRVFQKNKLAEKEINALLGSEYNFVNEYSILEKRRIPVLIKPFGNHSFSHEFLVWDLKRLLDKTNGIKNIQEHLTRDADITFIFKNKTFALEVETGKLLSKHNQLKEKIDYMNKKYSKRWMFIVSHRKLATKYRKFGLTSARSRMSENLSKLLEIAHT